MYIQTNIICWLELFLLFFKKRWIFTPDNCATTERQITI